MKDTITCLNMAAFIDGKTPKLRASCDACNESKIRCTQTKPKCARCKKQGIACIYGLSRRSHKNAPRIGASTASASAEGPSNDSHKSASGSPPVVPSQDQLSEVSVVSSGLTSESKMALPDFDMLRETPFFPSLRGTTDSGVDMSQHDYNIDFSAFTPTMNSTIEDLCPTEYDSSSRHRSISSPGLMGEFLSDNDMMGVQLFNQQLGQLCDCADRVIKQLAMMRMVLTDDGSVFDRKLSQLRHAINTTEDVMGCPCVLQDQMSIVLAGSLLGLVVQGFESTAAKTHSKHSPMSYSSSESSVSPANDFPAPQISWGMLHIEPAEENELKEHLWDLHFRKLQRVLTQFNASTDQLQNSPVNGNSAHAMACQFVHVWLSQRVEAVKKKFRGKDDSPEASKIELDV